MILHNLTYNEGFKSQDIDSSFVLDNPQRIEYSKCPLLALLNLPTKIKLDRAVKKEVMAIFQNKYQIESPTEFKKVWKKVVGKTWSSTSLLTVEKMRVLSEAFNEKLVYHGKGIPAPTEETNETVSQLIRAMLHGTRFPTDMLKPETASAIFLNKNPELLQKFGKALQKELENLIRHPPANEKEALVWRSFLGNIIALLPFYYPKTGETMKIPVLNEHLHPRLVEYEIQEIQLPLLEDSTPMTALGLTPKNDLNAVPILAYLGTTYPTGDGFVATLISDFTPGHSVGRAVYQKNKNTIEDWFEEKKDVYVVGMSLGGAMAFHTLSHQTDKLSRIDVYNPPGLYGSDWTPGIGDNVEVNIYNQPGDLVSQMGIWPTGKKVSLYTVMQHQGIAENLISSHVHAFTGCDRITIIKRSVEEQNNSIQRRFLKKLHQVAAPVVVYAPIYGSYQFYRMASKAHSFAFRKNKQQ